MNEESTMQKTWELQKKSFKITTTRQRNTNFIQLLPKIQNGWIDYEFSEVNKKE